MYDFLARRRSVRRYRDEPVPEDKLQRIVTAAAVAPSAHHSTPWHITVITAPANKESLAQAMGAAWERDLERAGVAPAERKRLLERSRRRFGGAPALILMSLNTSVLPDPGHPHAAYEEIMMTQSVAAAAYAILLAAAHEGLGAAWHAAPLFCPDVVRQALGLPPHVRAQALITVGYPDGEPGARPVRAMADAVTWMRA